MGCEASIQFELFSYSLKSKPEKNCSLKTFSPIFCVSPRIEYILDHECCSATLRGPYFAETSLDRIFRFSPDFEASDALRVKQCFFHGNDY